MWDRERGRVVEGTGDLLYVPVASSSCLLAAVGAWLDYVLGLQFYQYS